MDEEKKSSMTSLFDAIDAKLAEGEKYASKSEPEGSIGDFDDNLLNLSVESVKSRPSRVKQPE